MISKINKYFEEVDTQGWLCITSENTKLRPNSNRPIYCKDNTYKIKLKYLKRIGPMPHNGYRAFNNKLIKKILPKVEFDNILDWVEKKEKYK